MAKPIELGLELKGEDAVRFEEYLLNPQVTKKGRDLILKAIRDMESGVLKV